MAVAQNFRKVMFIANCHAGPLAQTLAYNSAGVEADALGIDYWFGDFSAKAAEISNFVGQDGHVISYALGPRFGALQSSRLREQFKTQFSNCTNIRFDGLHPDCTYFGGFGARTANFLSEYHSRIVIQSFACGRSVSDCIGLFSGKIFEKLGYFEAFGKAERALQQREADCDIRFCSDFLALLRQEYCLLTINHPTSIVFHELVRVICRHLDLPFIGLDRWGCPNQLAKNVVWPIFDSIAETNGLKYRTRQDFLEPSNGDYRQTTRAISLEQFVKASYAYYATRLAPQEVSSFARSLDKDGRFAGI